MPCRATADNHCCWVPGYGVCPHFDSSLTDGFCSLRARLGSWQAVHDDAEYAPQRAAFEAFGTPSVLCGDYPAGKMCATCGAVSNG